ncbi:hypothetical protein PHMEG_00030072 [Phytophthora megakarya]|uniref:Elicitin n=1 Tax=Phytophthora megakarya TaxID=4795 RepID=A0A225V218_9STRA|nr:hypothetical protein PHMEG_00030072 [Phytophthora megakarya]
MRLKVARSHALLGLIFAVSAHHTAQASECTTLLDSSSTLAKSISSWDTDLPELDYATIFQEIDTALPWLSKCAASIDPHAIYTSMASSSSLKKCFSDMENLDVDLSTNDGWSSMCTTLEKTLAPCVNTTMIEVMDALKSTDGCCDDFLDEVDTLFGDALDKFVIRLMELSINIECSQRKFKNLAGNSTTEMCAYSIPNSFVPYYDFSSSSSSSDTLNTLLNLAQIPNDQMCSAFEGKTFTTTQGANINFAFGTKGVDTMGICLQPLDTLFQYMKSWELFSATVDAGGDTQITFSDLFSAGTSIRGDLLIAYATMSTNLPVVIIRALDNIFETYWPEDHSQDGSKGDIENWWVETLDSFSSEAKAYNIHIPSGGGCTYSNQTITMPYAEAAASVATTSNPNAASTVTLTGFATAMVALVSTLVLSGIL